MKKVIAALTVIFVFLMLNACVESDDLKTDLLIDTFEPTMNIEAFEISPQDVNTKLASNGDFKLIDVRTPGEREAGHIKGDSDFLNSVDIEAGTVLFEGYDKNEEIVVYCRSGNRSERAYNAMKDLGFTNVKSMAGGINEWISLGYNTSSE